MQYQVKNKAIGKILLTSYNNTYYCVIFFLDMLNYLNVYTSTILVISCKTYR